MFHVSVLIHESHLSNIYVIHFCLEENISFSEELDDILLSLERGHINILMGKGNSLKYPFLATNSLGHLNPSPSESVIRDTLLFNRTVTLNPHVTDYGDAKNYLDIINASFHGTGGNGGEVSYIIFEYSFLIVSYSLIVSIISLQFRYNDYLQSGT